jgi:hypothetical protein
MNRNMHGGFLLDYRNRTMSHRAPLSPQPNPPLPPVLVGATGIVSMGAPSEERDIEKLLSVFYYQIVATMLINLII